MITRSFPLSLKAKCFKRDLSEEEEEEENFVNKPENFKSLNFACEILPLTALEFFTSELCEIRRRQLLW